MSRIGHLALGWMLIAGVACGATRAAPVSLDSDPPGAYLQLRGPLALAGVTPLPVAELLAGEYDLSAQALDRAHARGRLVLTPEGVRRRPWASPASFLLPPGAVHLGHGEHRGWAFLGVAASAAVMAIARHAELLDAMDDRDRARDAYERAVSETDIATARSRLLAADEVVADYQEGRSLWLGCAGAAWLGAALEALLLTPGPSVAEAAAGQYVVTLPPGGGARAALRSLLVPGAGQRSMKDGSRGDFFLVATAALAGGALVAHESFLDARREQGEAQRRFNEAQSAEELASARRELTDAADRVEERELLRWSFAGAAAAAYLWNACDAYGLGRGHGTGQLAWSATPTSTGGVVSLSWRLP